MVKKEKKAEKMKTHEIINELYDFKEEKRGDELNDELMSRYPFNYFFGDRFEVVESKLEHFESQIKKLLSHHHKDGKVLFES